MTRKDFHHIIKLMGYKIGIEIGFGRGAYSTYLLENSDLEILYSVDNWKSKGPRRWGGRNIAAMASFGERFRFIEGSSHDVHTYFEDGYFDFVYIDGNHKLWAIEKDLELWYPKVRDGGFFGGHDYVNARKCGVKTAVDNFMEQMGVKFILTDEPYDLTRTEEEPLGTCCSYWMIKGRGINEQ